MADKKDAKKGGKEEKKEAPAGGADSSKIIMLFIFIFVGATVLANWTGMLFDTNSTPVEDPETGQVVATDKTLKFPSGTIADGASVILKSDIFVRSAPGQNPLGKQEKYETAIVQEGPLQAYNINWWRLNFENAPDGWVPQYAITSHVTAYKALHIVPIMWRPLKPILWIISVILGILLVTVKLQLISLRKEAAAKLAPKEKDPGIMPTRSNHIVVGKNEIQEIITAGDKRSNERWMHILQLMQSHNQNDWRQAIIEADIILEEMLEKMGYEGVTIGDKLKNVEPSDFRTLNQAWEAHKVRNRIAHMGSEFQVNHRDAEKIINMYQEVFEEFYYI